MLKLDRPRLPCRQVILWGVDCSGTVQRCASGSVLATISQATVRASETLPCARRCDPPDSSDLSKPFCTVKVYLSLPGLSL